MFWCRLYGSNGSFTTPPQGTGVGAIFKGGGGNQCKFSSKGISKNRVQDPLNIYKSVLENKTSSGSTNVGFIAKNNTIFTYKQHRKGFSYFYCKRKVLDDGVSTEPLDITVQPIPSKFRKVE